MTKVVFLFLVLSSFVVHGQSKISWDGIRQLQFSDFKSPSTKIGGGNIYRLHNAAVMDFSFYMSNAEFMFTKNFNSKVNCTFNCEVASIITPDSVTAQALLSFAQYEFDLTELYARKFRKKIFEEKGAFSSASFFRPLYDDLQKDFTNRDAVAGTQADIGRNQEILFALHQEVLKEIETLSEFCKTCKPSKKKK